jgi:GDP-L-fucose synthase
MKEEHLLTGLLEPTNEPYAIAKIAGIKLCEAYHRQFGDRFFSLMPSNLYGPHDNFDLQTSHVLPALLRKFHEAKLSGARAVEVWGSGTPRREFLHVDDLADACVYLLPRLQGGELVNVGTGSDLTIKELVAVISEVIGYDGEIVWDGNKPDGAPRKLLDVSKLRALGWRPRIELHDGIASVYQWYQSNLVAASA